MANLLGRLAAANIFLLKRILPHVSPGHRAWLATQVLADRYDTRSRVMAGFFTRSLHGWQNKFYDVSENGEAALLARLTPFTPRVVFDVGANVGEWSIAACERLPEATVHAFEIAPSTATLLERQAARYATRLVVNRQGLSDHDGEVDIWFSAESHTATSTLREAVEVGAADHGITAMEKLRAQVTTGDAYVERNGINHIDLLKIDVEGAEPAVLAGFSKTFARGGVTMVQFEYGAINAVTRHLLADLYRFFEGHGFAVGKLFPEGVAFKPYGIEDEDFVGPNYIACLRSRQDIIGALGCPPLTSA